MLLRYWLVPIAYLALAADACAEVQWKRAQSADFEIYSSAGEREMRDTLRYFERVRSFFEQASGTTTAGSAPVRIVAFGSKKEYEPYRPNEIAIAYYTERAGRDYIVLSSTSADTFPVAVHEYVHLFVRHAKLNFPPWLNEGMAELYSTLKPLGNKVIVGALIPGRYQALFREKWVPLDTILAADQKSPYYNEKDKAGSLYNEGWALVHMLALTPEYRPKYSGLLKSIANGTPSGEALSQTYGKPVSQIDKDLQAYLRGDRFRGIVFDVRIDNSVVDKAAEPAPQFDLRLALTSLAERPDHEKETQQSLQDLARDFPQRPEPLNELGYAAWHLGKVEEAQKYFEQAFQLGDRGTTMLWDYGRMAERNDVAASIRAFNALLSLDANRVDVRLELAAAQLNSKQPGAALEALVPVKKVSPADAPRLFQITAYAQLQLGGKDEARTTAGRWREAATTPADKAEADRLLEYLAIERTLPPPNTQVAFGTYDQDDSRAAPILRRSDGAPQEAFLRTGRPTVEGSFVELMCEGQQAKVVVDVAGMKKVFLIEDPTKITVGGAAGNLDLSCGPQKPVAVRIDYDPPVNGEQGIDGVLRLIQFNP